MTKLKFDESKVINALHVDLAKGVETGVFANDIVNLKDYVEGKSEAAFGKLDLRKNKNTPFYNNTLGGFNAYRLFYPITQKEFLGEDYINYLDNYKLPKDYKRTIPYKEYCEIYRNRNRNIKKYLFSGIGTRTDWMDGEVYNADVDYGDSVGPEHGKKKKAVLIIEAPNELLAKLSAEAWFDKIGGWRKTGCNYMGRCWSDSNIFNDRRYFGAFDKKLSDKEIIDSVKLFDTKTKNNLDGRIVSFKFEDILQNKNFKGYLNVDNNSYDFERNFIIKGDILLDGKSLKEKVTESFKKAGLKYSPIYASEVDALNTDFDNTMNAIIESVKSFNSLDKSLVTKFTRTMKKYWTYNNDVKFVRPEVFMVKGTDENSGKIIARSITNQYTGSEDYYGYENTKWSDSSTWYITNKNAKVQDLTSTVLGESYKWLSSYNDNSSNDKTDALEQVVFNVDNFVIIPETYARFEDKKSLSIAKDSFVWDNIADGITRADQLDLEEAFSNIEDQGSNNILWGHLHIQDDVHEGHKCIKVHTHIKNGNRKWDWGESYSAKKSFKFKNYIKFLKAMYGYGYHVVKAENQKDDLGKYGYEEMDMYFAANRKGTDYDTTFTGEYWDEHVKPEIKDLW